MKLMQVHTFYENYLEDFYGSRAGLEYETFQDQTERLVEDGFGASHVFTPYLSRHGFQTQLVIANNRFAQATWLREQGLPLPEGDEWPHEVLARQVDHYRPDVLFLNDPIRFDATFLKRLSFRPRLVLGWRAAEIPPGTDWRGFDLLLSNYNVALELAQGLGARASAFFMPGFPSWVAAKLADEPKNYDVVFTGQLSRGHSRRCAILNDLAKLPLQDDRPLSLAYYIGNGQTSELPAGTCMYDKGAVWGMDMFRAIARGKIVMNAHIDIANGQVGNMRLFETTGVGSFMLTDYEDDLSRYFVAGREVETYRTMPELAEKIYYYRDHDREREAIARRGQQRCLRDYSMEKRAEELAALIEQHLAAKGASQGGPTKTEATAGIGAESPTAVTDIEANRLSAPTGSAAAREEHVPQSVEQQLKRCIDDAVDHLQAGRPIKAMRGAEEALAFGIRVPGLHFLYAVSLNAVGRHEEALAAARDELAHNPGHAEAATLERQLTQALIKPPRPEIPTELRGWNTSLPRETLLEIQNTSHNYCYRGIPMIKNPFDFAIYPLLIWDRKPRTIIEIGSKDGGSALWLADMLDNYGIDGHVYSLDIVGVKKVSHPRVTFLEGDGRDLEESFSPEFMRTLPRPLLVIEDADHSYETSSHVLSFFDRYLDQGESIIIEDGIISDLALDASYSSGPHLALKEFLGPRAGVYEIEGRYCDYFGYNLTWCTNGFLRRIAPNPELAGDRLVVPARQAAYPTNHLVHKGLIKEFLADDPTTRGIASQMSANERFQLYYALRKELADTGRLTRFVEIGSFSGASLYLTHQALQRRGTAFQGICVEPGGTAQFHEIVKLLASDVVHLPMLSHDAAARLSAMFQADRLADFIFVDGDHTYQGVRQDILDYYPLLAPGGAMLFHDYLPPLDDTNRAAILLHHGNAEPGIRQACRELMEGAYGCQRIELPLLYPTDPTQTQPQLPIIPGVFSTVRAYRKPAR